MLLAVNGTLMRGLELEENMQAVGAVFVREDRTSPNYRLWSIGDRYPGMLRTHDRIAGGIAVEIWEIGEAGLIHLLLQEPPGLCLGRVRLENGVEVLGILAEAYVVRNQVEITRFGGWRNYLASQNRTNDK